MTLTYNGDGFGNPVGGVRQGIGYDGRFGVLVDADLAELAGWSKTLLHASIHQIHGSQFSAEHLDNLLTVSGIEAPPSTRLFNLWIERTLASGANIRIGQMTAAQEFLVSENASLFVNSTFGWPVLDAQDLPSGGPAYPEATPGARVRFTAGERLVFKAAVFDGNPAGTGAGSPVERDRSGVAFRLNDPPLFIAELTYAYGQPSHPAGDPDQAGQRVAVAPDASSEHHPASAKVGAWFHAGAFADQAVNAQGGSLALAGGVPRRHAGDYSVYAVLDQVIWRPSDAGDRGLSAFMRGAAAPRDRNPIDAYADAGIAFKGPFAARPGDTIGLGFAYGRVSPPLAASDRALIAATGRAMPVRDFEAALELTYQFKLGDSGFVQPDCQYIIHPGGRIPDPAVADSSSPIPNALVLGVRTYLRF